MGNCYFQQGVKEKAEIIMKLTKKACCSKYEINAANYQINKEI